MYTLGQGNVYFLLQDCLLAVYLRPGTLSSKFPRTWTELSDVGCGIIDTTKRRGGMLLFHVLVPHSSLHAVTARNHLGCSLLLRGWRRRNCEPPS
jgi:hypothetical protein